MACFKSLDEYICDFLPDCFFWDLTGTGHFEIAVELELSWLSARNDHLGLVDVLPAPPR